LENYSWKIYASLNDTLPKVIGLYNGYYKTLHEDADNWNEMKKTAGSFSFDKVEKIEKYYTQTKELKEVDPGPQPETTKEYDAVQKNIDDVNTSLDQFTNDPNLKELLESVSLTNKDVKELNSYIKQLIEVSLDGIIRDKSLAQDPVKLEGKIINLSKKIYYENFKNKEILDLKFRNWVVCLFILAGLVIGSVVGTLTRTIFHFI